MTARPLASIVHQSHIPNPYILTDLRVCNRADELRYAAEKYGRVRDVYIPKDYYTGYAPTSLSCKASCLHLK